MVLPAHTLTHSHPHTHTMTYSHIHRLAHIHSHRNAHTLSVVTLSYRFRAIQNSHLVTLKSPTHAVTFTHNQNLSHSQPYIVTLNCT